MTGCFEVLSQSKSHPRAAIILDSVYCPSPQTGTTKRRGSVLPVSETCTFRSAIPLQHLAMKPTRRFFAVRGQALAIAGIIPVATAPEVKASKLLVPEPMVCSFSSEQLPFPNLVNIHTSGNLHGLHPRAGSGEIYEQQRMAG
jgi:hypothetical protein